MFKEIYFQTAGTFYTYVVKITLKEVYKIYYTLYTNG